ncbi:hypothetical protein BDP81DRAFT_466453 [Colletotrichum phormii]|uniref:UBZ4-type domain-containing protein n=1 Tax=Colletotrichum phormii TaxID=359342 RepID=A0AAI9ZD07_9PEZI|nr:uncharacterized protein BDP81DRAFT_466453 [Colletotrichum phormii]KAK1621973.1 hypothetical protein BDP81DRAFT_466453 [Colletotrichum phormii]
MARFPTIATVVRGAGVNIVLKADQPTGRTVSGTVQDVLTRGNHPRGIKVRLADGRVGRVQSHTDSTQQQQDQSSAFTEVAEGSTGYGDSRRPPRRGGGRRQDAEAELPSAQVGLEAYIRPAKQKNGGRGRAAVNSGAQVQEAAPAVTSEIVTCPVCGEFEGDAAAVEHHVAGHFD